MGILRTKTIEPATGSTLTLGASGDTITVNSDSIKTNTFKDAGGNTLFTSDGAGTLSSVNSAMTAAGPMLISTSTASNATSVDITSGIDSTYNEYMFVMTDIHPETDRAYFTFQVNAAGQSGFNETITSSAFASYHKEVDSSGTPTIAYKTANDQANGTAYQILEQEVDADNDSCTAGILHLFSPSSTTYVKHFHARLQTALDGTVMYSNESYIAGYINTTAAIDEISFKFSSGNMNGTIQMYGIK